MTLLLPCIALSDTHVKRICLCPWIYTAIGMIVAAMVWGYWHDIPVSTVFLSFLPALTIALALWAFARLVDAIRNAKSNTAPSLGQLFGVGYILWAASAPFWSGTIIKAMPLGDWRQFIETCAVWFSPWTNLGSVIPEFQPHLRYPLYSLWLGVTAPTSASIWPMTACYAIIGILCIIIRWGIVKWRMSD